MFLKKTQAEQGKAGRMGFPRYLLNILEIVHLALHLHTWKVGNEN